MHPTDWAKRWFEEMCDDPAIWATHGMPIGEKADLIVEAVGDFMCYAVMDAIRDILNRSSVHPGGSVLVEPQTEAGALAFWEAIRALHFKAGTFVAERDARDQRQA